MTTSVVPRAEARPQFGSYDSTGVRTITEVIKRDGRRASWDPERITRAIALAFWAARHDDAINPHASDAGHRFGLGFTEFADRGKVRLLRDQKTTIYNAKEILKDPSKDVRLRPGDQVDVPTSFW